MSTPNSKKRKMDDLDSDYFEKEPGTRPRPSYASSFPTVAQNQSMKRSNSGNHFTFESAITPGVFHTLDKHQNESIPQKPKDGKPRPNLEQHPAMDHIDQFAAIQEVHDSTVHGERKKAQQGLKRTLSVDLFDAFSKTTKDPTNLRLVTHKEHVSQGGSTKRGNFTQNELTRVKKRYESFLPSKPSTQFQQNLFDTNRPQSHTPLPGGQSAPISTRVTRSQKKF